MKRKLWLILVLVSFITVSFVHASDVDFYAELDSDQDGTSDTGSVTVDQDFDILVKLDIDPSTPIKKAEFSLNPDVADATITTASSGTLLSSATISHNSGYDNNGWRYGEVCSSCSAVSGEGQLFVTLTARVTQVTSSPIIFSFNNLKASQGVFPRTPSSTPLSVTVASLSGGSPSVPSGEGAPESSSLIAHWDFETSPGNQDLSQNNNDLTVSGPIYSATGGKHNDGTLEFDGIDDIATAPDSDSLKITNSLTMSALFNIFDNGGNYGSIIVRKKGEYEMFVHKGKLFARLWYSATAFNQVGGYEIDSNTWYHVSVTFDGATLVMYLDGDEIGRISATQPITDTTNPVSLGRYEERNSVQFKGLLDDIKIFDSVLTGQQVCLQADKTWDATVNTCVASVSADLDGSGTVDVVDLRAFITEIEDNYRSTSTADQDGDGIFDWEDIKLFLKEYLSS